MDTRLRNGLPQLWTIVPMVILTLASTSQGSLAAPGTTAAQQAKAGATVKKAPEVHANTATSAKTKRKKGDGELLWKVTSDSGATLYLLGTIHVFKPEYYPLPDEMEKAFAKARALIVEIDMTKVDPKTTQSIVAQRGLYAPPDNLTQHLSASSTKLLQDFSERRNLPFNNLTRMKPWLVAMQVLQTELQQLGYVSSSGIDLHFMNEANKSGKKVIGLEALEFQLNLFANLPDDLQEQFLTLGLIDLTNLPTDAQDMMKAWNDGDDKKLEELLNKDVKEHPELEPVQEKILYERNITMAQKLEAYLKGGTDTYVVAIGSGHLVGDRSVIALLKKQGYKITQVHVGDQI